MEYIYIHAFSDYTGKIEPGVPKWIQAAPLGAHYHPIYGDVSIDTFREARFIQNFKNGVYGPTLNIGYEHFGADPAKGFKSAGKVLDVKAQDGYLWYLVDWTEPAAQEINAGEWNFFSYEFMDEYTNDKQEVYQDVLAGGALTNDPFFKGMTPVNFSEVVDKHPELAFAVWSTKFINDLPDSAFLYIEPGGKKDGEGKTVPRGNRHFPFKGTDGKIDLPHLRNAIARIPQAGSWLSQEAKDRLQARARKMLQNASSNVLLEEIEDEHADLEHSEPGTGSPPERRTDNDIPDDELYRIDTPPIVKELEEEGSMEEFLKQLRAALGLKEDAKEEEVAEAFADNMTKVASVLGVEGDTIAFSNIVERAEAVDKELAPLRDAAKEAQTRNAFRDQFPQEYQEMENLKQTDVENKAKAFSGRYERFPALDKEGKPTSEKSTRGFSALVLNDIEDAHKAIAQKKFSQDDLEKLLDHVAGNGIVDYSEKGSSREKEGRKVATTGSTGGSEARQAFSAFVQDIMEEDQLEYADAVKEAAKRDPELFEAYKSPLVAAN